MSKTIYAVRISLDTAPAATSEIGLYDVGGSNSQLRWIESDIAAYSPTVAWKTGIFTEKFIDAIEESVDITQSGNTAEIGSGKINITNTVLVSAVQTQVDKLFNSLGIRFNNLLCEIIRFDIVAGALTVPGGTVEYRGKCGDITYNETSLSIPIMTAGLSREAFLGTVITDKNYPNADSDVIGKCVPVTFGKWTGQNNRLAKFVKTANKETKFVNTDVFTGISPAAQYVFPIVGNDGNTPTKSYTVLLGNSIGAFESPVAGFDFTGKWMRIVEGGSSDNTSLVGQSRKIASWAVAAPAPTPSVTIVIEDYFEKDLSGNATAKATNNAWVEFSTIASEFECDVWPCNDFKDSVDPQAALTTELELYAYTEKKPTQITVTGAAETVTVPVSEAPKTFLEIPHYTFNDSGDGDHNKIVIDVKMFSKDIDTVDSFIVKPIKSIAMCKEANLGCYNISGETAWTLMTKVAYFDGIYTSGNAPTGNQSIADLDKANDRDLTTYLRMFLDNGAMNGGDYAVVFEIELPDISDDMLFDDVYLLMSCWSEDKPVAGDPSDGYLYRVRSRKFIGWAKALISPENKSDNWRDDPSGGLTFDNMLDDYVSRLTNYNVNFYYQNDTGATITGWKQLKLSDVSSAQGYRSVYRIGLIWLRTYKHALGFTDDINIKEIAVLFHKSLSIKDALYTPLWGRTYNNTWGSRKTSADVIYNPLDILEHTLRLQNWTEVEAAPATGWGHAYATAPLIYTDNAAGGFDYTGLDQIRALCAARQIFDYKETSTRALAQSLCKQFFLVNYQNSATGKECVSFIADKWPSAPTVSISLANIIGAISDVQFPQAQNIYCEPIVRYCKNTATGGFEKCIRVTQSGAAAYVDGMVTGYAGSDAADIWARCHALWGVARQIEQPPSDMTDCEWIYDDATANWYLDVWLQWMGAVWTASGATFVPRVRFTITVPWATGKDLQLADHVLITLPHQTDSAAVEFGIERISRDFLAGTVTLGVYSYGNATEIAYYVQDVVGHNVDGVDWQDHIQTQAVRGSGGADIQDNA